MALELLGGAAVGALGTLGGGFLGDDTGEFRENRVITSDPSRRITPGFQIMQFNNLVLQGVYDPSILDRASPIGRLVGDIQGATSFLGGKTSRTNNLVKAIENFRAGGPKAGKLGKGLQRELLQHTGFSSLEQLFAAEEAWNASIADLKSQGQAAAGGNLAARQSVQNQINQTLQDLPDASAQGIQDLRDREQTRFLRDLNFDVDQQRSDLLELANAGNFNPGRPLEGIERFRADRTEDSDLIALQRALSLMGGRQALAGTQLGLLGGDDRRVFDQGVQLRNLAVGQPGQATNVGGFELTADNSLANAIAASTKTLGGGIAGVDPSVIFGPAVGD